MPRQGGSYIKKENGEPKLQERTLQPWEKPINQSTKKVKTDGTKAVSKQASTRKD